MTTAGLLRQERQQEAVRLAAEKTANTGRKFVVRDDQGQFFICPLYATGQEGRRHDPGYAGMGTLVKESL